MKIRHCKVWSGKRGHSFMTSRKKVKNLDPHLLTHNHPVLISPSPPWMASIAPSPQLEMFRDFPQKLKQWDEFTYVVAFFFANAWNIYRKVNKRYPKAEFHKKLFYHHCPHYRTTNTKKHPQPSAKLSKVLWNPSSPCVDVINEWLQRLNL